MHKKEDADNKMVVELNDKNEHCCTQTEGM